MWDSLWYPKTFLVHSIGLRANLIAIGNGKSLYRPSGTVFAEMRHQHAEADKQLHVLPFWSLLTS